MRGWWDNSAHFLLCLVSYLQFWMVSSHLSLTKGLFLFRSRLFFSHILFLTQSYLQIYFVYRSRPFLHWKRLWQGCNFLISSTFGFSRLTCPKNGHAWLVIFTSLQFFIRPSDFLVHFAQFHSDKMILWFGWLCHFCNLAYGPAWMEPWKRDLFGGKI